MASIVGAEAARLQGSNFEDGFQNKIVGNS